MTVQHSGGNRTILERLPELRVVYGRGENVMEYVRDQIVAPQSMNGPDVINDPLATLIAYDLQAGTYVDAVTRHPERHRLWCEQIAKIVQPLLPSDGTLLEVGVGEATTLAGVLRSAGCNVGQAYGFDASWSRIDVAREWLRSRGQDATLFVGDLLRIPMRDASVDVVYSSHSLEPNRGHEAQAIAECARVAKLSVVLVEPIYELASAEAQKRMLAHGYVQGLRNAAEDLGLRVMDYRLLDYMPNPLNPSGVIVLQKQPAHTED